MKIQHNIHWPLPECGWQVTAEIVFSAVQFQNEAALLPKASFSLQKCSDNLL